MPRVSAFDGIAVRMYYDDHPPPHLHAFHAGREVLLQIDTLKVLRGSIAPDATRKLREWAFRHRPELLERWEAARSALPLQPIEPLR